MDAYGNVFVEVSMDKSTTMFSCHTDTVHPKPHADFKNKLVIDPMTNHLFTDHKSQLGADDGTGIWFMLAMIEAKVPGLYAFHRDEEVGGLGSSESAKINKDYLAGIEPGAMRRVRSPLLRRRHHTPRHTVCIRRVRTSIEQRAQHYTRIQVQALRHRCIH